MFWKLKQEVRFSPPNLKRIGYPKNTIYMKWQSEQACLSLGNGTNITNNCCFIENGTIGLSVKYQAVKCDSLIIK